MGGGDLACATEAIEAAAQEEWRADARFAAWLLANPRNTTTNTTNPKEAPVATNTDTYPAVKHDGNAKATWVETPALLAGIREGDDEAIATAKERLRLFTVRQRAVGQLLGALRAQKAGRVAMHPANATWRDSAGGQAITKASKRRTLAAQG